MCKTPNDAVIPVGSYLQLTTYRASHWNSLGIHTNEYNYRYHEHRPRRLLIMVDNSGMQGERNPGVCNRFCHIHSAVLSSFTEGLKCSFSSSQLPETHGCCDTCQGRGENYFWNSSRGVKGRSQGISSLRAQSNSGNAQRDGKASDIQSQSARVHCGLGMRTTHLVLHINLPGSQEEPRPLQCMPASVLFSFTDIPSPLHTKKFHVIN